MKILVWPKLCPKGHVYVVLEPASNKVGPEAVPNIVPGVVVPEPVPSIVPGVVPSSIHSPRACA